MYRSNKADRAIKLNKELKLNQKYTLINTSDLIPYSLQFTLIDYNYQNYAQFNNCLRLIVKAKGKRRLLTIDIYTAETVILLEGWQNESCWNKEKVNNNESRLFRKNIDEFRGYKNLVFVKAYGENFYLNNNFETFYDNTSSFLNRKNISPKEAINDNSYIEYVKILARNYNLDELKKDIKKLHYNILLDCLNKTKLGEFIC